MVGSARRRSEPRERLLATAARLFYAEGIHAVGVDRLAAEAGVTKATFYRHFPTKDDLVLAYIRAEDATIRGKIAGARELPAGEAIGAIFAGLAANACRPGFRGCPFINAAAEYPDAAHPVRRAIHEHRTWLRDTLAEILTAQGHPAPDVTARELTLLHDGALVAGYLADPRDVRETLHHAVQRIVGPGP
ncbi:TetR family transcriptional regulator [Herbihabitans rhizosphaerae]|uniref:TetR family transcriptional regulator n=1 Tax=Herbihabitans rhizosphaerae TaxID=1872711 RepID=A0A4Q7KY53_9PSEU|nr:TetR/AcrR family transcriptional regulator [Herbihabitans rhizosphaerae]RZS41290.1 TetR family transcriptional regulator [Herbihabitans rhizosphaerae]